MLTRKIKQSSTKKSPCSNTGIYSDLNANYVNAVTNELYLSVAAHLANRVPNRQRYFDVAKRQWNWFKKVGFINEHGTINDGLTDSCENNQQPVYVPPIPVYVRKSRTDRKKKMVV